VKQQRQLGLWIGLLTICVPGSLYAATPNSMVGRTVDNFRLRGHRGAHWSLAEAQEAKLLVVAFLGTECPLAKLYGPRLQQLQEKFADQGVLVVGINSNTQDSVTEITRYVTQHELTFPFLKDPGNRVADAMQAARTPEVFLLDEKRVVRYHGRIDDQYAVGLSRNQPRRRDLEVAIGELLAGKPVSVPETKSVGCYIGRVNKVTPVGDVTYSHQIAPIFHRRCVSCHRDGELAPFTLTSYDDILGWEDTILEVIDDNRMPPWFANSKPGHFRNDPRLTDEEKTLLRTWIENGMPEGDPKQTPPLPKFTSGWQITAPDEVLYMREAPFAVSAEGVVDYQYFVVDPKWQEDKYICAAEARPDNRSVVHHIIVYVLPPGERQRDFRRRAMLVGYAPGSTPTILQDDVAIKVAAGSKLVFEMHYTPNGSPQMDRSYAGFKFMDKKDVKKELRGRMAIDTSFAIAPGDANKKVKARYRVVRDELLLDMTPHMHLRGKAFRYELVRPGGERELLLDVPKYDFNWQLSYQLSQPKLLPRGSYVECTAWYDNSDNNFANPDATKRVRWGDQSWEEMMIGFFKVVAPDQAPGDLRSQASIDPSGEWTWQRGNSTERLKLKLAEGRLTGELTTTAGKIPIDRAVIQGDRLKFQATSEKSGGLVLDFDAVVTAKQITGRVVVTVEALGRDITLPWKATREQQTP